MYSSQLLYFVLILLALQLRNDGIQFQSHPIIRSSISIPIPVHLDILKHKKTLNFAVND